jgi:predicted branched-subunit amino acid permease
MAYEEGAGMTTVVAELTRSQRRRLPLARAAFTDALPVLAGIAPFALVIGVATTHGSDGVLAGLAGGPLLFGGSAQLTALSLLAGGTSVIGAVTAIALINARLLVYSAVLAPAFSGQPGWFRWCAPHFIVEPTYALTTARHDLTDSHRFRSYWLAASAVVGVVWCGTMALGAAAGPLVPHAPAVTFLPIGAFLTMLAPLLVGRPAIVAAMVAVVVAVAVPLPDDARVLFAIVAGSVAATVIDRAVP